jgi:autotransporter-associated beta strand protein
MLQVVAATLLAAGSAAPSHADSGVWTNANGGLWSDPANWNGGVVADGSDWVADFSTADPASDIAIHLDSPRILGSLLFGDTDTNTAAGWTLDNNGDRANVLTFAGTTTNTVGALGAGKTVTLASELGGSATLRFAMNGSVCLLTGSNNNLTGVVDIRGSAAGSGLRLANPNALGLANTPQQDIVGNGASNYGSLQLTGGIYVQEGLYMYGRPASNVDPHVVSVAGTNTLRGNFTFERTGTRTNYGFKVESGLLTIDTTGWARLNDIHRLIHLQGAGVGIWKSNIANLGTESLSIVKEDGGIWKLQGTNSYGTLKNVQSTTRIIGGVLVLDGQSALSTNTALLINGGVLGLTSNYPVFTYPLGTTNARVRLAGSSGFSAYGGTQTVNLANSGLPLKWGSTTNWLGAAGQFLLSSADADGTLDFQNSMDFAGSPRTNNVRDGSAVIDAQFSGILMDSTNVGGGMVKTGPGALALTASNTYGGGTTVNAGTLLLMNVAGSATGTGAVTVKGGGALGGTGTAGGDVGVEAGGTLSPGPGAGTLTVGGNLALSGTCGIEIRSPTDCDRVVCASNITFGGTLIVTELDGPLTKTGTFNLFDGASTTGDFAIVSLPSLLPGLRWHDFGGGATFDYASGTIELELGIPAPPTMGSAFLQGSQTVGVKLIFNGGSAVTSYGTSWDVVPNGTNSNMQACTNAMDANGVYLHERTDLAPGMHCYVWGWSSNGVGLSFTPNYVEIYTEPVPASNVSFTDVTESGMTVHWENGNGAGRVVVLQEGGAPSAPVDSSTYAASSVFGSGAVLGGGFVVYDGMDSNIVVSGLLRTSTYYVAVYEYAGSNTLINYRQTSPATGSQVTLSTPRTFIYDGADAVDLQWNAPANYMGDNDYPRLSGDRLYATVGVAPNAYRLNGNRTLAEFRKIGPWNRNTRIVSGSVPGSVLTWDTGNPAEAASFYVRQTDDLTAEQRCCTAVDMVLKSSLVWDGSTQFGYVDGSSACIVGEISGPGKLTLKWNKTRLDFDAALPMYLVVSGGAGPNTHEGGTEFQVNSIGYRASFLLNKQHATGRGSTIVGSGAEVCIANVAATGGAIQDDTPVYLGSDGAANGKLWLEDGVNEAVSELYLFSASEARYILYPPGTYGSSQTSAKYRLDNWFGGPGVLTVRSGAREGVLIMVR